MVLVRHGLDEVRIDELRVHDESRRVRRLNRVDPGEVSLASGLFGERHRFVRPLEILGRKRFAIVELHVVVNLERRCQFVR